jgi:hypothetical protein
MNTNTLITGNRWSNQIMGNQDRRRLQQASILKTSILVMNISKSIHQEDTRVTSKQLSTERLKLITKSSQEVIGASKLMGNLLIPT